MESVNSTAIIWFRNDLRTSDNAALAACAKFQAVIPLYIYDDQVGRPLGSAKKWWLHHALLELSHRLEQLGSRLVLRRGNSQDVLSKLIEDTGASTLLWNRRFDAYSFDVDNSIKAHFKSTGINVVSFSGQLMHEPTRLFNKSGAPFKVFTPFWKTLQSNVDDNPPLPSPQKLPPCPRDTLSDSLNDWQLFPKELNWTARFDNIWQPGEQGAAKALDTFVRAHLADYQHTRNFPSVDATSRLSPFMTFGEISPRQIWFESYNHKNALPFRRQLAWRDFSYYLLFHNKDLATRNFNAKFDTFDWNINHNHFDRWKKGKTGYPIVDAGMRELWQTGYMHNRVRMIVASFLTKHLLIDWRLGEQWFWDTLLDADPANNPAGWQWVAGSGADASPYYRIFNPITQGKKFDPDGEYVRKFVTELSNLSSKHIHTPWDATEKYLSTACITLGKDYPHPIIEHNFARKRALQAYQHMKEAA